MKLNLTTSSEVSVYSIADALASAQPDEFAAFFLRLSEKLLNDHPKMMEVAEAMAPEQGGNRKKLLRELMLRIDYFEVHLKWKSDESKGESK